MIYKKLFLFKVEKTSKVLFPDANSNNLTKLVKNLQMQKMCETYIATKPATKLLRQSILYSLPSIQFP